MSEESPPSVAFESKDKNKKKESSANKEKKEKKNKKNLPPELSVGTPYNLKHNVHVNFDFQWEGQNPYEVFTLGEKLGEGSFGCVYKGYHKESNFVLAIKEINGVKEKLSEDIKTEIEVLKKCKNNNVVAYFGTCIFDGKIWVFLFLFFK